MHLTMSLLGFQNSTAKLAYESDTGCSMSEEIHSMKNHLYKTRLEGLRKPELVGGQRTLKNGCRDISICSHGTSLLGKMVHKILLNEQLDNLCVNYRGKNITSYIIWGWGVGGRPLTKFNVGYFPFSVSPHCRISNLTVVVFLGCGFSSFKIVRKCQMPHACQASKYFKINFVHRHSHDLHEQGLLWGT